MLPKIIGIVGLLGSGKNTAAELIMKHYEYVSDSFASPLKDCVSIIFGWDRELLEGDSRISREWRDQVDEEWATFLEDPTWTPRKALQYFGTDVVRRNLNEDIWLHSLKTRTSKTDKNVIITDCRFPNEIKMIKDSGGIVIRVKKGEDPEWFKDARVAMTGELTYANIAKAKLEKDRIHASEYSWVGSKFDYEVYNDGNLEDLENAVCDLLNSVQVKQNNEEGAAWKKM